MFANTGFRGQHDRISAIEYRIGNVENLRSRRRWLLDHRLHHLSGDDDETLHAPGDSHQSLLHGHQKRIANLHPEIAAGDHDAVSDADDFFNILKRFGTLNLRNNAAVAIGLLDEFPGLANVVSCFDE